MKNIKILAVFLLPVFLISWLLSQDLTEAAKKEKERREAAEKSKKITVITNADLHSIKKKAAAGGETAEQGAASESAGATNPSAQASEQGQPAVAAEQESGPAETPLPMTTDDTQKLALESNYARAKEYADLLETKVNALWNQFYAQDDMTPKDLIQQQISDTFDKYQKARADEAAAKDELDNYLATVKK